MPRKQAQKESASNKKDENEASGSVSPQSSIQSDSPMHEDTPRGKKRAALDEAGDCHREEGDDFGNGIQKMLECFGSDYIKTSLLNKKKRIEQLTQGALRASSKTVDDIWRVQTSERQRLQSEYFKQLHAVCQQWESDIEKTKEQETKLTLLYKQQQKLFEQARAVQSQRLKTIKQLHGQYIKGMEDLEKSHHHQATSAQSELKKEMGLLQKKILMDTQKQEMANVKKSLQTMLF